MSVEVQPTVQKLENPKFTKGFCMKPGFRYFALNNYCKEIEFITDGFTTNIEDIAEQIADSLDDFCPEEDCIVPTGTGITNILVGYYLASKYPDRSITVAFFQRETTKHNRITIPEHYEFYKFNPGVALRQWS